MKKFALFLLLFFPLLLFGQGKYNIKVFSENNTGFPLGGATVGNFVVRGNQFIIGHSGYDQFNPGGVTFFDGEHWKLVTRGDNGFPFTNIGRIFYTQNTNKLYVYGRPYGYSTYYWISRFNEADNHWESLGDSSTFQAVNGITTLCETDNGDVYIGGGGFWKVTPDSLIDLKPEGEPLFKASFIHLLSDGNLALVTNYVDVIYVYKYLPGTGIVGETHLDSIQYTYTPYWDNNENLWLTDNNKIVKWEWNGDETVYRDPFTDINLVIYYATSNQDDIWMLAGNINSNDYYIVKFNTVDHTWEKYDFVNPFNSWNYPLGMQVTDNYIYITNNQGIMEYNKTSFEFLDYWNQNNTGKPGDDITSIVIDKNKHYWFNSLNQGISMFNGDTWNTESPYDINKSNVLTSWDMCVDNLNRVFLVGDSVYYYENAAWHTAKPSPSFYATSVAYDNNNNIWIADNYTGLCKYSDGDFTYFTTSNSDIPGNDPNAVFVDKDNNLWIGFRNSGIAMYDGNTFHTYNSGLPQNVVYDFAQTSDGTIWAALLGGGLAEFSNGSWTIFNSNNSGISSDDVRAIAGDNEGNLWIGDDNCTPLYVTKFDGTSWEKVVLDSTTSSSILEITVDENNNVFVSPAYSPIFVINENNVVLSADNQEKPSGFVLYQNYPNPFNPTTTINYAIPSVETRHALSVQLTVYDILGRKVATLVNNKQAPGKYSVTFDASRLGSGIYFYTLRAGDFSATKKMILLK